MRVVLAVEHIPMNATLLEEDWYSIPINALRNIALHHASTKVGVDGCTALQNQTQQIGCGLATASTELHRQNLCVYKSGHLGCLLTTQFVMLLDGDFPGPSTQHAHLRHSVLPALRSEMINRGTLLVMPAFDCQVPWKQESEGLPEFPTSQDGDLLRSMFGAEPSSTAGKNAVVAALETGEVIPFQHEYHSNTDYDRWCTAVEPYVNVGTRKCPWLVSSQSTSSNNPDIPQYESYVVALKSSLPRWDERFQGYVRVIATTAHVMRITLLCYRFTIRSPTGMH